RSKTGIHSSCLVDLSDAGMLQPAERLGLLFEPPQQLWTRHARPDDLQRNGSAGLVLFGFVNNAHSTFADDTENAISPNSHWRCANASRRALHIEGVLNAFRPRFQSHFKQASWTASADQSRLR